MKHKILLCLFLLLLVTPLACQVPIAQTQPAQQPLPSSTPLIASPLPPATATPPELTPTRAPTFTVTPPLSTPTRIPPTATKTVATTQPVNGIPTVVSPTPNSTAVWARNQVESQLPEIMLALRLKDMKRLSPFVHPRTGVRFTPYAFVTTNDRVYLPAQLINAMNDTTPYLWGAFDGTGYPIKLTFSEYYAKFVYSAEFSAAPVVTFNQEVGVGNAINNASSFYPGSIIVEYHYPGFDPQFGGFDWKSLRLVFDYLGGKWYLVGIIHVSWTI